MRTISYDFSAVVALAAAVRTASAVGGAVDRLGFEGVSFLIITGEYTNGSHAIALEESDDTAAWTPIAAAHLTKAPPVIDAAGEGNAAVTIGYTGDARYVRVKSNVSGGPATGAVVGAIVLLGRAHKRPVAN